MAQTAPQSQELADLRRLAVKATHQRTRERFHAFERFETLWRQRCQEQIRLVYVDEAHSRRDLDLGYGWAPVGQVAWRLSECTSLDERISWYGAYDFTENRSKDAPGF